MQRLKHIESPYHHYFLDLLWFFYFLAIEHNLYTICLDLDLFFEVDNTINQNYQKKLISTHFSF